MRTPPAALCLALLLATSLPPIAAADYRDDIGHHRLEARLGTAMPTGAGIPVALVEAVVKVDDGQTWQPDPGNPEFAGKTLLNRSGAPADLHSGHATTTARMLFGTASSVAPGITSISVYSAEHWLGDGALKTSPTGTGPRPGTLNARLASHSWVANAPPFDGQVLRRTDWLIDRDELIQVVGLTNGGTNRNLLANAYNVISAGRSDGSHGRGSVALDLAYTAGRTRPDVVIPAGTTSEATPKIAAVIALLLEFGKSREYLATDPVARSTTTRLGGIVHNQGRSEVIRALLMAGALRRTANTTTADLVDYRKHATEQTANGLDRRYGAGQVNVYRSHAMLAAGEQNSVEDHAPGRGEAGTEGFDYDPAFGGANGSNSTGTYFLPVAKTDGMLSATLAWNLRVAGGPAGNFSGTTALYNLDLELFDVTGADGWTRVAKSASGIENTENLWVPLRAGRRYALRVTRGAGQDRFDWDYALAWYVQADTPPDGLPIGE